MADVDRLFPDETFDAARAPLLLRRLQALSPSVVDAVHEKLDMSRAEVGSKLVVEDWLFDGDRLSEPAVAELLAGLTAAHANAGAAQKPVEGSRCAAADKRAGVSSFNGSCAWGDAA